MTAPSPFLPNSRIQVAWDSTSLGWLKTCARLYFYQMIEGWRAKGTGVHLIFGQHYHSALELYDKARLGQHVTIYEENDEASNYVLDHEEALRLVVERVLNWTWPKTPMIIEMPDRDTFNKMPAQMQQDLMDKIANPPLIDHGPWASDHPAKNRETLIRSIIWYLDNFKDDPAATLILANGKPAVELSFRMELDWGPKGTYKDGCNTSQPYILSGHLDRVVEFGGQKYVCDRKTTGSGLTPHYFENYAPDNQMSLYTIAARIQFSTPVAGVIIDAAQVAVSFTRFQRGFTYRTEAQLEEWLSDLKYWFDQAEGFAERNYWPQNDKACGMYGGCTFRKICSKSPEVRERFLESDFERKPWNPLQSRG